MAVCSSIPTKNGIALRKIFATNHSHQEKQEIYEILFAGAATCEVDKQGRILLPANLREYAGIDKEVVSVGVYSRVEIWSKDRYLENSDLTIWMR